MRRPGRRPAPPGVREADARSVPRGGRSRKYPEQIKEGLRPWQASAYCLCRRDIVRAATAAEDAGPGDARRLGLRSGARPRPTRSSGSRRARCTKCQGTSQLPAPARAVAESYLRLRIRSSTSRRSKVRQPAVERSRRSICGHRHQHRGAGALSTGPTSRATPDSGLQRIARPSPMPGKQPLRRVRPAVPALAAGRTPLLDLEQTSLTNRDHRRREIEPCFVSKRNWTNSTPPVAAAGVRLDALADDGVVTPGQNVNVSVRAASGAADPRRSFCGVTLKRLRWAARGVRRVAGKAVTCKTLRRSPPTRTLDAVLDAAQGCRALRLRAGRPLRRAVRPLHSARRSTYDRRRQKVSVDQRRPVSLQQPGGRREALGAERVAGVRRHGRSISPCSASRIFRWRSSGKAVARRSSRGFRRPSNPVVSAFRRKIIKSRSPTTRGTATASVTLQAPFGLAVEPASAPVTFAREDEETTVTFALSPPGLAVGESAVTAIVTSAGG